MINFWALINESEKFEGKLEIPARPTNLSEAGKVGMWKVCHHMNKNGPLKGKIEMPEKPAEM